MLQRASTWRRVYRWTEAAMCVWVLASVVALSVAQHLDPQTVNAKVLKTVESAGAV